MMVRFIRIILAFFIISVIASTPAFAAEEVEYRLDALGLTVSIPGELITLTRDIDPNDPNLEFLGFDAKALLDFFESKYIYLDAIAGDYSYEYSIKMPDIGDADKPDDFNLYTIDSLLKNSAIIVEGMEKAGGSNITVDVYSNSQTKFYLVHLTQVVNNMTTYTEMYYTYADGKPVTFNLDSYGQKYNTNQQDTLRRIVDSAKFDHLASEILSITKNGVYVFGFNIGKVLGAAIAGAFIGGIYGLIVAVLKKAAKRKAAGKTNMDTEQQNWQPPYPPGATQDRPPDAYVATTPEPKQITCPNCCASNFTSDTTCTSCGAPLHQ